MRAATLIVLGILPAVAACAPLDAPLSPTLGAAVASLQVQIIPPTASADTPLESSGARAVAAVQRYERGQPKAAGDYATSSVGSTIGGKSSAGAGLDR